MNNKIVIYGVGSCAQSLISEKEIKSRVLGVVAQDVDNCEVYSLGWETLLKPDTWLDEIAEEFDLVIASQYFDIIIERLTQQDKLKNEYLRNIIVPDLLMQKLPYDGTNIEKVCDDEWDWLISQFGDEKSLQLLRTIRNKRSMPEYPKETFIPYSKACVSGREDYWHTVHGRMSNRDIIVIDVGAYIGDSIVPICDSIGRPIKCYYALEPVQGNYEKIMQICIQPSKVNKIIPIKAALGKKKETRNVLVNKLVKSKSAMLENSDEKCDIEKEETTIMTLDQFNIYGDAEYFVKMDIEGSELDALTGGESFIRERKPNLAICVYHKQRDIIEIPKFLKKVRPDYQFYLVGGCHTILIAK